MKSKARKVKPNLELATVEDNRIVIKGKKLDVRWLDSYILIWSGEEHDE
jgi:hypothetical protein